MFLVETKNPTGIVEVRDGDPWLVRRHDPEGARPMRDLRRVLRDSAELHEEIERRCGLSEWVSPIVVFWCDFPEGLFETDKVAYIHGSRLSEWLDSREQTLAPERVASIAAAVAGLKAEGDMRAAQRKTPAHPALGASS